MKREAAVMACIVLAALLAGTLLNSVAFGGGNPLDTIWQAFQKIELRFDSLNATVIEQQQQISELQAKLDTLNSTLTARIEALEELLKPPEEVTFLNDTFDTGLDNWSYWEEFYTYWEYPPFSNYELQWISHAALISGDGYAVYSGMQKTIDLSEWDQTGKLTLSLDWRATSNYPSSSVTNAAVKIQDADSNVSLYSEFLVLGGTTDTGWRNYANDISSYALGHTKIRIILSISDGWIANWQQTNAYDNIKLTASTSA